jgi:hypothetical protein
MVLGDAERLLQVVRNVLENATTHTRVEPRSILSSGAPMESRRLRSATRVQGSPPSTCRTSGIAFTASTRRGHARPVGAGWASQSLSTSLRRMVAGSASRARGELGQHLPSLYRSSRRKSRHGAHSPCRPIPMLHSSVPTKH